MAKLRIGEILMAEGKIDEAQLRSALSYQRRWGKKLGDCVIDMGFVSEIELCQTLARFLRLPLIDVTRIAPEKITREVLNCISVQAARKQRIVPLAIKSIRRKKRLVVATSDPTNYVVMDEIQFKAGLPLLIMVAPDSDIDWFVRKYYLNEGEALPHNYISGISLIEHSDPDSIPHSLATDPVSSIFFDEDFTGHSKQVLDPSKKKKDD